MSIRVMHVVRPVAGGIKNHLLDLIGASHGGRFRHMVACPPGSLADALTVRGIKTFGLPLEGELSPRRDLACVRLLVSLLKSCRVDVVHAHGYKAGLVGRIAAKAAGVPAVVLTVHGSILQDRRPTWKKHLFAVSERFLAGLSDRIITVSGELGREIADRKIASPEKLVTIYNGIAPERFNKPPDREYLQKATGIPAGKKIVGTVSRLAPQKGVGDFIKAAARLAGETKDTVFLVAGDGPLRSDLERKAAEMNLAGKIFFTGERQDIQMILPCLDVFVLASVTEGMPLTVLEALAAGRPVVATRVGGIPEAVSDGVNGLLVSPGDAQGMAAAILRLLEDPGASRKMGEEGRKRVAGDFTVDKMVGATEQVYMDLVSRGSDRLP